LNNLVYKELGLINETMIEGATAVNDAIDYLTNTAVSSSALTLEPLMTNACSDHVVDTGPSGEVGDTGADGSTAIERANRFGTSTADFL
jgi:hypothetical protein